MVTVTSTGVPPEDPDGHRLTRILSVQQFEQVYRRLSRTPIERHHHVPTSRPAASAGLASETATINSAWVYSVVPRWRSVSRTGCPASPR